MSSERLSASGRFLQLECRGTEIRLVLETEKGREIFLIEDPDRIAVTNEVRGPRCWVADRKLRS
jgi:hypothetical protein